MMSHSPHIFTENEFRFFTNFSWNFTIEKINYFFNYFIIDCIHINIKNVFFLEYGQLQPFPDPPLQQGFQPTFKPSPEIQPGVKPGIQPVADAEAVQAAAKAAANAQAAAANAQAGVQAAADAQAAADLAVVDAQAAADLAAADAQAAADLAAAQAAGDQAQNQATFQCDQQITGRNFEYQE